MADTRGDSARRYERSYLLSDCRRNDVLTLDEVLRYGRDSFDDPDYVSLYGRKPAEWYALGVRLRARTVVECTRDALADRIGRDIAAVAQRVREGPQSVIVDPFAGSANTLFWLARHVQARRAVGFELDSRIFETTVRNLAIVGFDADVRRLPYDTALLNLRLTGDELLVVFVAPPWGDAFDAVTGLDLRRTQPPIGEIVDLLAGTFREHPVLVAVQLHELVIADSLADVRARLRWSTVKLYDINAPGENHGILLGTLGWTP